MSDVQQRGGAEERLQSGRPRQLRLALVCYGGVSLCIYMHGNTKEIHRLVKASQEPEPAPDERGTVPVYREVLAKAVEQHGVRTEVVVDVISATSAGGINGIFLAKALAHDLSQENLRDLWFDKGDIRTLLHGPRFIPWKARLLALLPRAAKRAPLRGEKMSLWLWEALHAMDARPAATPRSLMPPHHELELFVTTTDFHGYNRTVAIDDPKVVHDERHRHWFRFARVDEPEAFGPTWNLALGFAARATSAFPLAFPLISPSDFRRDAPRATGPLEEVWFRQYELAGREPHDTYFVDGGVLDNHPFGLAIDALRRRPAEGEVDRRLVYLEPDPAPAKPEPGGQPSPVKAILASMSSIPRADPILDDILAVGELNERVERVREVVESSFGRIRGEVLDVVGDGLGSVPDEAVLAGWQADMNERARAYAGHAYETYLRVKVSDAVDALAASACVACDYPDDSNHAALVRGTYRCWARQGGLFAVDPGTPPDAPPLEFLKAFDLAYGVRRLLFVVAGLNWWYMPSDEHAHAVEPPSRAQLDAVKARLWDAIAKLRSAMSGSGFGDALVAAIRDCFPEPGIRRFIRDTGLDPEEYLSRDGRASLLDDLDRRIRLHLDAELQDFGRDLYADLVQLTESWEAEHGEARRDLLVRFLGFPLRDVLVHPIVSSDPVGELDRVKVVRMSPRDSDLLDPPSDGDGRKLKGADVAHFSAFFERSYRENDYLWGRLDAAERMIGIVLGTSHEDFPRLCGEAFLAILEEEGGALADVRPLVDHVRAQATELSSP